MFQLQILLPPVVALMGLAFLFNAVLRQYHDTKYEKIALGFLFGGTIVLGMTSPLSLGDGLIFDTRTLLLGAAVAFGGPLAGLITLGFGLVCRILVGGAGMTAGLVGLVLAFGVALAWTQFVSPRIKTPILRDALTGLAITSSAVAFFVLPYALAVQLLVTVLPTLLLANVLGLIAIGLVFRREMRHATQSKENAAFAQFDMLTNLLNRRGMDSEIQKTKFDPQIGHAMFYFDIDNFKFVNDTHGHGAGDAALAIVAARIKDGIRGEAVFSRHGGDEFSIYMPRLEAADVRSVAERLRAAVCDQVFTYDDITFDISISIGVFWSKTDMPIQEMIDKADAQLLLAKQAGKNRAQVAYDAPAQSSAVA